MVACYFASLYAISCLHPKGRIELIQHAGVLERKYEECWYNHATLAFNIIANLRQDSEKLLLLFGEELPLQSGDTWGPDPLVPSDNLPFNVTVVLKFSCNKDKIVTIKVNRNTLFSSSLAFGNELNQIISKYLDYIH